jgi:hypothetical protein
MTIKHIRKLLKKVYPIGKISIWYCRNRECSFLSQSSDDAASHEIRMIGLGKHKTKLFTRN